MFSVKVYKRPLVAIIPTGSELVHYKDLKETQPLKENEIIEYNSMILAGLVRESGGIPFIYDIVPDIEEKLIETMRKAIESDAHVVIINAGSSAGSKDYTAHLISQLGEVLVRNPVPGQCTSRAHAQPLRVSPRRQSSRPRLRLRVQGL